MLTLTTIGVGGAVWRRQRNTCPCDTLQTKRTIGVGLTSVGCLTDIVLTDHLRQRTVAIGLTHQRWRTTVCVALPCRRTICGALTCRRHTVAEVAALTNATIVVDATIGARLTEETVTHGAGRAIRIDSTLSQVHTPITDTLEAHRTWYGGTI